MEIHNIWDYKVWLVVKLDANHQEFSDGGFTYVKGMIPRPRGLENQAEALCGTHTAPPTATKSWNPLWLLYKYSIFNADF